MNGSSEVVVSGHILSATKNLVGDNAVLNSSYIGDTSLDDCRDTVASLKCVSRIRITCILILLTIVDLRSCVS